MTYRQQKTISCDISIAGVGLHSGCAVKMLVKPAPEDSGVVFKRIDLPGKPEMLASYESIDTTFMCTCLHGKFKLMTVEHFLAAVSGLGIDNLIVELDAEELPILDGSSRQFVFMLQSAGIILQQAKKSYVTVSEEFTVQHKDGFIRLKPYDGLKINFQIDYQHPAFPESVMQYTVDFDKSHFMYEVAAARTYGFLSEFDALRDHGLIKGGSLDNALVFDNVGLVNPGGMRYANECVRHKILDVVGDFYLLGKGLQAEITCYKSGHTLNHMAVKKIAAS